MKALFDTSVLVAAMVTAHPEHARAFPWLKRAHGGALDLFVSAHGLAELYAVLSTLPVSPRIQPATAERLIRDDVLALASVADLAAADYEQTLTRVAALGLSGGIVYDALVYRCAENVGADTLLTLNRRDFDRLAGSGAGPRVQAP